MKICVTFLKTPEIEDYAHIAEANRVAYCQKHGYELRIASGSLDKNRAINWSTIIHVLKILEEDKYDWVFKTDADALIKNFDIKIENLIDENFDFIFTKDAFNALNCGNFLVRNSLNSQNLLKEAIARKDFEGHPWPEQGSLIETLKNNPSVKYVPQRTFNSYPPESGKAGMSERLGLATVQVCKDKYVYDLSAERRGLYHVGDFLLHVPGVDHSTKTKVMKAYS